MQLVDQTPTNSVLATSTGRGEKSLLLETNFQIMDPGAHVGLESLYSTTL